MKTRHNHVPKIETVDETELMMDPEAGEIEIKAVEPEIIHTPMGTTTVDIVPGNKVKIIGIGRDLKGQRIPDDMVFTIIQKLSNQTISLSCDNYMIYVHPENIRNIK